MVEPRTYARRFLKFMDKVSRWWQCWCAPCGVFSLPPCEVFPCRPLGCFPAARLAGPLTTAVLVAVLVMPGLLMMPRCGCWRTPHTLRHDGCVHGPCAQVFPPPQGQQ